MELKTTSVIKRKDKLVRKLKKKFGEGIERAIKEEEEEDESEEDEQGQSPLEITQGLGEDEEKEQGVEEEEGKEAPSQAKLKKRKAKTQPTT